ncbi:MAG TPA: cupin domain-containing protein [Hyphomicrobiaceae bacterium]|jgi:hypothetical protein
MKTIRTIAIALLMVAGGLALHAAQVQQPGIKRTDLLRQDLSVPGREIVQVRVDFAPGVEFGKHSHPGEEIAYVLTHAEHHWRDWYAPYLSARQNGSTPGEAAAVADRYMEKVLRILPR